MSVTAFEISLNGKVLCTVGMEGWSHLSAHISGGRITKEMYEQMTPQKDENPASFEEREMEWLSLVATVGIQEPDNPRSGRPQGFGQKMLSVGDVVTIRVIQTDSPALPRDGTYF